MKLKLLDTNEVTLETKDKLCKENISLVVDNTNIAPENIKSGVSILGVNGTYVGSGSGGASYEQGYEAGSADALKDVTTLKSYFDTTKSALNFFKDYSGESVEGLIKYGDTSEVGNMSYMFKGCTNLTSIPALDTSKVGNMTQMFYGCTSLTTIPLLDTSNVITMSSMFYDCKNLTSIPLLNTSNVSEMQYMFESCSSLTSIPELDTSKVTTMRSMFERCKSLTTIPALDASKVTNSIFLRDMFRFCSSLKTILMYGMQVSFSISDSTKFEASDLVTILNNLATVTSTQTLTMGATNLAKLTDEQKAIATNKGWTLA